MYEAGAQWTIVGPDGTTVQINDGVSAWFQDTVTGWDSASIRTNVEDLPEDDGGVAGDSWLGQRPWTQSGIITTLDPSTRNNAIAQMQQAIRALRGDCTIKTQPTGMPAMQCAARLQSFRVTGSNPKSWQLAWISADPRAYSQTLNVQTAIGLAAAPGAAFDWAFPVDFGGGSGATLSLSATNAGNIETPPIFKVWGPCSNPQIMRTSDQASIYLDGLTLAAGQWVQVDVGARTVVDQSGTNLYYTVRGTSSWWKLLPGSNGIQLWATGATAATELDVSWRDAWA